MDRMMKSQTIPYYMNLPIISIPKNILWLKHFISWILMAKIKLTKRKSDLILAFPSFVFFAPLLLLDKGIFESEHFFLWMEFVSRGIFQYDLYLYFLCLSVSWLVHWYAEYNKSSGETNMLKQISSEGGVQSVMSSNQSIERPNHRSWNITQRCSNCGYLPNGNNKMLH